MKSQIKLLAMKVSPALFFGLAALTIPRFGLAQMPNAQTMPAMQEKTAQVTRETIACLQLNDLVNFYRAGINRKDEGRIYGYAQGQGCAILYAGEKVGLGDMGPKISGIYIGHVPMYIATEFIQAVE